MHAEGLRFMEDDLREVVSKIRRDRYYKELQHAGELMALRVLEHRVMTDGRLTDDDREVLMNNLGELLSRATVYSRVRQISP